MSDNNLEKQLRDEITFWQEYIDRNIGQKNQLIPRMYDALDFAKQRLDSYLSSQSKETDVT